MRRNYFMNISEYDMIVVDDLQVFGLRYSVYISSREKREFTGDEV